MAKLEIVLERKKRLLHRKGLFGVIFLKNPARYILYIFTVFTSSFLLVVLSASVHVLVTFSPGSPVSLGLF